MPRLDFYLSVPYTVQLHKHTPYKDRFPFNSRYREEVNSIFLTTLPKRLCR